MAGSVFVLDGGSKWTEASQTVGTTAVEITSALENVATVIIQADKENTNVVYFGPTSSVNSSGDNAAGQLQAGQPATLTLNLTTDSKLYIVGGDVGQKVYIGLFDIGEIC